MSTDSRVKTTMKPFEFHTRFRTQILTLIQNNSAIKDFLEKNLKIGHVLARSYWTMKLIAILTNFLVVQGDSIWWNRSMNTITQQARYIGSNYQGQSKANLHDMIRFYIANNPKALHVIRRHQNIKRQSSKFRQNFK